MMTRPPHSRPSPLASGQRLALMLALVTALRVSACSTPVFQYALENWSADLYDLVVAANGLSEAAIRAPADAAMGPSAGGTVNAGLRIRQDATVAVGSGRIEVRLPHQPPATAPFWAADWSVASLRQIVDSPVRARLADELLHRAAAVFLFLPSGDAGADRAARTRLQATLDELSRSLVLPTPEDDALPPEPAPQPQSARFAILDVPRDDPAEAFLRRLLLASEPDLASLHEPMAFPVFGRGRVLYAIVGGGINREVLAETCAFLAGACSCQVKAQNPGVDMLLRADWGQVNGLEAAGVTELPPLTLLELPAIDEPPAPAPQATPTRPAPPAPPPASTSAPAPLLSRRVYLVAAMALAIAGLGSLALLVRSRSR